MITKIDGICQYDGCAFAATHIASGRNADGEQKPAKCYCEDHAVLVSDDRSPEYTDQCPNCGSVGAPSLEWQAGCSCVLGSNPSPRPF